MLCFVNIMNLPSYRSFPGMYSLWVFQLHRVDFKKLYLELMSVLIFKAKKSISIETQNKKIVLDLKYATIFKKIESTKTVL